MPTFREFLRVAEITAKDKTSSKRMGEIVSIMRRYHVARGLTPEKAVAVLEALGPTYVKIGQLASSRSDLLPKAYCDAFEQLHDHVAPLPYAEVLGCIDDAYGVPWTTVFSSIDEEPLGAASIAQVHRATLLDGTVVAVKVRRPGIVEQMAEDITLMKHLLALAELTTTSHQTIMLSLDNALEELERTTANEVDFTVELRNLERFQQELADQEGVTSPMPYPAHSTDSVLVMEYVEGVEIDDVAALRARGVDPAALAGRLVQSYVTQVLDDGFFHADPHPGNILVRDGEIVWIDLGMTGSLTASQRMLVGRMFRAVATNNAYDLKEAVLGLSTVRGEVDHGALLSQMSSLLEEYGTADLSDINMGAVFQELVEVLRTQNLIMAPSVTMLARGVVTLEGVMAAIDPGANVVQIVSKHVVRQSLSPHHIEERVVSLLTASAESAEAMTRLPRQVSNAVEMLNRGELSVTADMKVPANALATLYAVCGRIALAMISAGLFMGSSILCTTNMEPRILEVPVLGALGYLGALVLGVYVIYRTLASRHRMRNDEELR
ncbi:ABC1 kinase family protein [Adlercreutzia faecimuris]|uniref:AarF/UbiB family protein n=1 Tax=Adlercreutzia faecimuris TaxID=2897341 RepID=A0ABS9WFE9_9ACTN|nr:lipopolysaccharide core heptose(II) kinase RfaY [Adlercreutzia sp. JBNU-10]MCI2241042.1 AarF/UbiB family protein [Adlercreutzia sp. JBNU-10]